MSPHPTPITLHSPLTLRNAFTFPLQSPAARRDLLLGAALLLIPILGWMLNMGHRLRLIHRLQRNQNPWPAWSDFPTLLLRGGMTTLVILTTHIPAIALALAAYYTHSTLFSLLAAVALLPALFLLPGFMTIYALDYDARILLNLPAALRRIRRAGRPYLHAWLIVLPALLISLLGLLILGVGFLLTSVWLWQVAAFSFGSVFSRQHDLIKPSQAEGLHAGSRG